MKQKTCRKSSLFLSFVLLIWILACIIETPNTPEAEGETSAPKGPPSHTPTATNLPKSSSPVTTFPSHTPTHTFTPLPSDTPTPTEFYFEFPELLASSGIPLVISPCFMSESKAVEQGLPAIIYENEATLCIFGFPASHQFVNVNIINPRGEHVDLLRLPITTKGDLTYAAVPFKLELDMPVGEWRVTAAAGDLYTETTFSYGLDGQPILSYYHVLNPPALSPLDPRRGADYLQEDTIEIQGINFSPQTNIPLGIYQGKKIMIGTTYTPIKTAIVLTDSLGAFRIQFQLNDLPDGEYKIVAITNIDQPDLLREQKSESLYIGDFIGGFRPHFPNAAMALGDDMRANEVLYPGHAIRSDDGRYMFIYQVDGNLVLYQVKGSIPLWASNTAGSDAGVCIMQADGNLVIYDPDRRPLWASNTEMKPGNWLIVQSDGNVVIYRSDGSPVWATNTYRGN